MLLGMSQENLAERLGLTFQQVQKYEKGLNRVSASRLFHLSEALGVEVQYFFDDLPAEDRPTDNGATEAGDTIADPASELHDFLRSHDGITLARVFSQIDNADVKRALIAQMQAIARRDRGT
jgi:transcriptional regulator with XRE-family HTH domain